MMKKTNNILLLFYINIIIISFQSLSLLNKTNVLTSKII